MQTRVYARARNVAITLVRPGRHTHDSVPLAELSKLRGAARFIATSGTERFELMKAGASLSEAAVLLVSAMSATIERWVGRGGVAQNRERWF